MIAVPLDYGAKGQETEGGEDLGEEMMHGG
jgi:hypothetical protein